MTEPLFRISSETLTQVEDRFDRFRQIRWWNQDRLARAKILVVGAGALGNELIKNLALLGIGHLFLVDLDTVENSNLSRSVLYREADNGQPKVEAAATAARALYPQLQVRPFHGNIVHDVGLGVFRWADVVLGGLDNREARLSVVRAICPRCPSVRREVVTFYRVTGAESFLDRTLSQIGVPAFDIVFASVADRLIGFELSGDARAVLGNLATGEEDVAWN